MQTKETADTNGAAPDLMEVVKPKPKKRGRPKKVVTTPRTAEQIADDFEAKGKKYLEYAKILRGKA
jgi:hypothetical protein